MKSIMQSTKECYICGATHWLQLHHVYGGRNRKQSDKNGFTCWLCEPHHTGYYGVHGNGGEYYRKKLMRECQEIYELNHTRKEFMAIIGRNYLEDDT